MTLTVADNRELVGWILSFGSRVRVRQPASLREAVRQEAKTIAAQPEDVPSQPWPLPSSATRRVNRQPDEGQDSVTSFTKRHARRRMMSPARKRHR
jgi:hypothetical protein